MRLLFDIPDDQVRQIALYIRSQQAVFVDPDTKTPVYPEDIPVPDFLADQLATLIDSILDQFPTPSRRQLIIERNKFLAAKKATARPSVIELKTVTDQSATPLPDAKQALLTT